MPLVITHHQFYWGFISGSFLKFSALFFSPNLDALYMLSLSHSYVKEPMLPCQRKDVFLDDIAMVQKEQSFLGHSGLMVIQDWVSLKVSFGLRLSHGAYTITSHHCVYHKSDILGR